MEILKENLEKLIESLSSKQSQSGNSLIKAGQWQD